MTTARVAGHDFDLTASSVERSVSGVDPEPIQEHYVVVRGRRYPPKQVLAEVTGLDRADFTTHQARAVLRRVGFGVYRRGAAPPAAAGADLEGPHRGAEAALLEPFRGRWVAQDGLEVLFDADRPEAVLRWLRRHGRTARVWLVPSSSHEAGSALRPVIVPYTELPNDAGGGPRPLLDVAVADMDELRFPCLVDSGAVHTLVPRWLADAAGIGLRRAQPRSLAVATTATDAVFVTTRLTVAGHTWEADVGFCHPWPYSWGLLGQRSFFRYFTVIFRAADFELELTPVAS